MPGALARTLRLDGRGRLIDVGCGPGIVTLELAQLFEEVVGVDADPDMIREAETDALRGGTTNASWRCLRAEDLPAGLGTFRVATLAQSFHWMDREHVAEVLHTMLEPEGALVHISAYTRMGVVERTDADPLPQPPWDAITELIRTYAGSETLEGQGRPDVARGGEDDILRAWFVGPELVSVPDGRVLTRTADQVVAAVYSVSTSAPGVLGEEKRAFESDLRDLLHETSSTGMFSQATGDTGLRIWRPRS